MTQFEQLVEKLSDLFELDKADLDFGIHRIIKTKHKQITDYLNTSLPAKVTEVLGEMAEAGESIADLRREITRTLGEAAFADGDGTLNPQFADTPLGRRYTQAVEASQSAAVAERDKAEVYSHLYEFFSRYYEDGDFITRRRRTAGKETYAIPYDGEEVVLHWANKDQYYIKSSEDLKDYTFSFSAEGKTFRVHFKLSRMDPVPDNNKATRLFQLDDQAEIQETDEGLVVPFHFAQGKKRPKAQEAQWEQAVLDALPGAWQARLAAPDPTYPREGASGGRTILEKHLRHYTKKNTSDYFIHKDLGGFLRRELDFYIKNEVMYLDDVDSRPADYLEKELRKIKTIRQVAHDLIDFLAQFEDFQKKLWEKKKFVVETHWCITLDRVPEALYAEIAANEKQREEWVKLFAIDQIEADTLGKPAYCEPLTAEFLKANDKLVLDTAFFPTEFKYRLLAGIEDIDSQTDGLLVHSENFQALNLLQERYEGQVKCVYIDPPYNAPKSEIAYKNNYKHSSFLSLLESRLIASRRLNTTDGSHVVAIDKNEGNGVERVINQVFPEHDVVAVTVEHNRKGVQDDHFSFTHEYAIFAISPSLKTLNKRERPETEWEWSNFRNWGGESLRSDAANCFYAVLVDAGGKICGFGDVWDDDSKHPAGANVQRENNITEVYPIDGQEVERKWRYERGTVQSIQHLLRVEKANDGSLQIKLAKASDQFKTVWYSPRYNAGDNGTKLAGKLMGIPLEEFDYPKSVYTVRDCIYAVSDSKGLIFDYFAGSGTTAHAVIDLNREDGGHREYVLVEIGEYFASVTKPRVQKVVYSSGWKDGKPTARDTGISHCFKYIRLESYEDTLNNLELEDRSADLLGFSEVSDQVAEDYLLRYSLEVESRRSLMGLERFGDPFNCTLKIYNRQTGAAEPTTIDLPETFNYLLGLRVRTMQRREGFLVIEGENPAAETVLVIWRNVKEKDNAALERFVTGTGGGLRVNPADTEYAAIYINGDTTLEDPHKKVLLTEQAFHDLMFDVKGL